MHKTWRAGKLHNKVLSGSFFSWKDWSISYQIFGPHHSILDLSLVSLKFTYNIQPEIGKSCLLDKFFDSILSCKQNQVISWSSSLFEICHFIFHPSRVAVWLPNGLIFATKWENNVRNTKDRKQKHSFYQRNCLFWGDETTRLDEQSHTKQSNPHFTLRYPLKKCS